MTVTVTPEAKKYLKQWLVENEKPYMWLSMAGGGCAGFEYDWRIYSSEEYEAKRADGDEIIPHGDGHRLILDFYIAPYLAEGTIDFARKIEGSGIVIKSPLIKGSCGCGASVNF